MADRRAPLRKSPEEILADLMAGHQEALISGAETAKKYLQNFSARNDSLPNAVKFFLFDLLAEDAYQCEDLETCRSAVARAQDYLPAARDEMLQRFRAYSAEVRLFERGIALAIDDGEFDKALALCNAAIALGFGPVYTAKRASIERMM